MLIILFAFGVAFVLYLAFKSASRGPSIVSPPPPMTTNRITSYGAPPMGGTVIVEPDPLATFEAIAATELVVDAFERSIPPPMGIPLEGPPMDAGFGQTYGNDPQYGNDPGAGNDYGGNDFWEGDFSGGNFSGGNFSGGDFSGGDFSGGDSGGF